MVNRKFALIKYLIQKFFQILGTFAPMVEYNSYGAPVPCMQGSTVYSSNLNQFVYFGGIASPNISPYRYRYDVGKFVNDLTKKKKN